MRTKLTPFIVLLAACCMVLAATTGRLLINRGLLQSDLDGGGYSITNASNIVATHLYGTIASGTNFEWQNTDSSLLAAGMSGQYQLVTAQYDSDLVATGGLVLWPDGTYGVFVATNINSTFLAVDGYTLTYTTRSKTIAQPTVLRDGNGLVTNTPPMVIAP